MIMCRHPRLSDYMHFSWSVYFIPDKIEDSSIKEPETSASFSSQQCSSFDFRSLFFSERQKERLLTKKLKAEGCTRESTLGFALNFYDALTDKAAEVLSAIRIRLVEPIPFELHQFVINERATSFSMIVRCIFNIRASTCLEALNPN